MTMHNATFDIEALKLLSDANIGLHLWHWESPLMGGGDEATPTYLAIDWETQVPFEEWKALVRHLLILGNHLAEANVVFRESSDEAILVALGLVNPERVASLASNQVATWNTKAKKALIEAGLAKPEETIDSIIAIECFRGADPEDALQSAVDRFGIGAVTAHAVKTINELKRWWDYADYLESSAYDEAYAAYVPYR